MQNAALSRPQSWSTNATPGYGSQPVTPATQRPEENCSDSQFIILLEAYGPGGGLARGQEVLARVQQCQGGQSVRLAHWIVHRKVICFDWQSRMWLPLFQFALDDMTPLPGLDQVLAELVWEHDPVQVAQWFVQATAWLNGETPADTLLSDPAAVLRATRADRRVLMH
jgi:hypothetical protein